MSDRYRITYTDDGKPRMYDHVTDEPLSWTDMERTLNGYEDTIAQLRDALEEATEELDFMYANHHQVSTVHDPALQALTEDAEDMGAYEAPSRNQVSTVHDTGQTHSEPMQAGENVNGTTGEKEPKPATREELVEALREAYSLVNRGDHDTISYTIADVVHLLHRIRDILSREQSSPAPPPENQ